MFGGRSVDAAMLTGQLVVTGGTLAELERGTGGSWNLRIDPDGRSDVTVSVTGGRDCNVSGAICTNDGRALHNSASVTVPGPGCDYRPVPVAVAVAVDAVPIVVSSTTDDYFVLYASFDVDGETWEIPVAVVLGEAGTTTLAENAETLPAERYRVEKYLVADAADVDGDCVDDLTELAGMPNLSPVNSAMAIDAPDGTLPVTDFATFSALAHTRPYETSGTTTALGVKFLATDVDTDRPGLYLLNANKYAYHFAVIDALAAEAIDVVGLITYDPSLVAPDGSRGAYYIQFGIGVLPSFSEVERL